MDMITYAALQKQIRESGGGNVPTNVSAFVNDAGYQTEQDVKNLIPDVPTKVSELENDRGYQTAQNVREMLPTVPTKVSELENDREYQTAQNVREMLPTVPTKVSELENDKGYLSKETVKSYVPTKVSELENDSGYQTAQNVRAMLPEIPTKVSSFTNDAGYMTAAAIKEQFPCDVFSIGANETTGRVDYPIAEIEEAINDKDRIVALNGFPVVSARVVSYDEDMKAAVIELSVLCNDEIRQIEIYKNATFICRSTERILFRSDTTNDIRVTVGDKIPTGEAVLSEINRVDRIFNMHAVGDTGKTDRTIEEIFTACADSSKTVTVNGYPIADGVRYVSDAEGNPTEIMLPVLYGSGLRWLTVSTGDTFVWEAPDNPILRSEVTTQINDTDADKIPTSEAVLCEIKKTQHVFNIMTDESGTTVNRTLEDIQTAFDDATKTVTFNGCPVANGLGILLDGNQQVAGLVLHMFNGYGVQEITINKDGTFTRGEQNDLILKNDTTDTVAAGQQNKIPTADAVYRAIEDAKSDMGGGGEAVAEIFYVSLQLGAEGFLLDGISYTGILEAYNNGKRLIAKGYVPEGANLGVVGMFELPLSYQANNGNFVFSLSSGQTTGEIWVLNNNTVSLNMMSLVSAGNITESLNANATNEKIPTAKAVYDYVEGRSDYRKYTVVTCGETNLLDLHDFEDITGWLGKQLMVTAYVDFTWDNPFDIEYGTTCMAYFSHVPYSLEYIGFSFCYQGRMFDMRIYNDDSVTITEVIPGTT